MNYHPHDAPWIKEMVAPLDKKTENQALEKYRVCFTELMAKAGDDPTAKQAARTETNTRFRRYIEARQASTA